MLFRKRHSEGKYAAKAFSVNKGVEAEDIKGERFSVMETLKLFVENREAKFLPAALV
jgi:hypothetical protein